MRPTATPARELVTRTLNALSALQQESGAFASLGYRNGREHRAGCAGAVRARHRARRRRAVCKNGVTCVEALYGFATADGFAHIHGGETDALATAQALSALRACETPQQSGSAAEGTENTPAVSPAAQESGTGRTVFLVAAVAAVAAGAAVFLRVRFTKQYQK
ncbi:MAG: hypothetical protein ACLUFV_07930 [Acutalibacteraceae bacterium]